MSEENKVITISYTGYARWVNLLDPDSEMFGFDTLISKEDKDGILKLIKKLLAILNQG